MEGSIAFWLSINPSRVCREGELRWTQATVVAGSPDCQLCSHVPKQTNLNAPGSKTGLTVWRSVFKSDTTGWLWYKSGEWCTSRPIWCIPQEDISVNEVIMTVYMILHVEGKLAIAFFACNADSLPSCVCFTALLGVTVFLSVSHILFSWHIEHNRASHSDATSVMTAVWRELTDVLFSVWLLSFYLSLLVTAGWLSQKRTISSTENTYQYVTVIHCYWQ